MAIYGKLKTGKTEPTVDIVGEAANIDVKGKGVPDLNGATVIHTCDLGVNAPTDAHSGRASGKINTEPVTITKSIDPGTKEFLAACEKNQPIEGTIYYSRFDSEAAEGEEVFMTVEVKLGRIVGWSFNETGAGAGTETVEIAFDAIVVTHTETGIEHIHRNRNQ